MLSWSNFARKSFSDSSQQSKGLASRDLWVSRTESSTQWSLISTLGRVATPHSGCCPPAQRHCFTLCRQMLGCGQQWLCGVELDKGLWLSPSVPYWSLHPQPYQTVPEVLSPTSSWYFEASTLQIGFGLSFPHFWLCILIPQICWAVATLPLNFNIYRFITFSSAILRFSLSLLVFCCFFFKFLECNVSRFQKEEKLNSGV